MLTRRSRSQWPEPAGDSDEAGRIRANVQRSLGGPADDRVRHEIAGLRNLRDSGAVSEREYAMRIAARLGSRRDGL
jgi:hypothetical protein